METPGATPVGRDLYEVLGVERTASAARIRQAYRRLARRLHPDVNPNDRVVGERFRRVRQAFEVLADPGRRAEYDRRGNWEAPPAEVTVSRYGFAGFDFGGEAVHREGTLHEIFGRRSEGAPAGGDAAAGTAAEEAEGRADLHTRVRLSFVESLAGKQVQLRVRRNEACLDCGGSGERPVEAGAECASCSGAGQRTRQYGHMVFSRPCERCSGQGARFSAPCAGCAGRGFSSRAVREVARVPAGVEGGATVVLEGKGHERSGGRAPGDLRLHVEVEPHPILERRGDNLICPLPLTMTEAALGGRIEVPTLSGPVTVRLPPGIQPGTRLRLAGRGVRSTRGDARGDLFLEVQIRVPEIRDGRCRELLREVAERYPQSPRSGLAEGLSRRSAAGKAAGSAASRKAAS